MENEILNSLYYIAAIECCIKNASDDIWIANNKVTIKLSDELEVKSFYSVSRLSNAVYEPKLRHELVINLLKNGKKIGVFNFIKDVSAYDNILGRNLCTTYDSDAAIKMIAIEKIAPKKKEKIKKIILTQSEMNLIITKCNELLEEVKEDINSKRKTLNA